MSSHIETERAYSPALDAVLPDLSGVSGVVSQESAGVAELDATYFDTRGQALLGAGVTLRRRTGGADEGWHLKLPTEDPHTREEVHAPLAEYDGSPPDSLLTLVDGWTRGSAPVRVARIRTRRATTRLLGAGGRILAEVADDRVVAHPAQRDASPLEWREWEVELVDGSPALLDAVEALFAEHGVTRSPVQRKIEMVLGRPDRHGGRVESASHQGPARLLLHPYLAEQVGEIERLDPRVRRDAPEGVHGLRKACRRLRAVLGAYRPLLDRGWTDSLRDELGWFARALSEARDHEVVHARLESLLDEQPESLVLGPVRSRFQAWGEDGARVDQVAAAELLSSPRYHELRDTLDRLAADPPWTAQAEEPADAVFPRRMHREWRRVRRSRQESENPHELRKAAKRLRHALEVLEPLWGDRATAPRRVAQALTQVLGERQDAVVTQSVLLELSRAAAAAGEDTFTYGRLHAAEVEHETMLWAQARAVWRDLKGVVEAAGW